MPLVRLATPPSCSETLVAAIATESIVRVIARSAVSVWPATVKPAPLASTLRKPGAMFSSTLVSVSASIARVSTVAARRPVTPVGVDRELAVDRLEGDRAGDGERRVLDDEARGPADCSNEKSPVRVLPRMSSVTFDAETATDVGSTLMRNVLVVLTPGRFRARVPPKSAVMPVAPTVKVPEPLVKDDRRSARARAVGDAAEGSSRRWSP